MESIELMGKEVLPEFIERDEKAVAEKAKRLEPVIEKVEARRPASKAPVFDETYAFGGLPTGRENYTANEVSLAMDEMNAGIEQAAAKLKSGEGWDSRNPADASTRQRRQEMTWDRSTTSGATTAAAPWSPAARRASVQHVARQLTELGAEVVGLDLQRPALQLKEFHEIDLSDPASIDRAVAAIDGPVDALFNIAGVSSGIGDPLRVVTINFLGTRQFTEALVPSMPPGSAIANVSSLAASEYRENAGVTAGLLDTATMAEGIEWCQRNPEPVADGGGYRLSKEAIILYGMANVAALGAKGIRINCTAPGVTDTPILDQLRTAYGQEFLDSFQTPLGRVAGPDEQASVLVFLNSARGVLHHRPGDLGGRRRGGGESVRRRVG